MISLSPRSRPATVLFDRLEQHVDRHPEKTLFSFLDATGKEVEHHSYGSFWERIETLASHLHERAAPGERALLVYPPGLEMICALFACARAGLIPVPTAPATAHGSQAPLVRMSHIAADSGAALLLTDRGQQGRLHTALDRNGVDLSAVRALDWHPTDDWREPAGAAPERPASDVFLLQYTSGSTSHPKGVVVGPGNVLHNCDLVVDHPSPVAVSWLPQHHDMGLLGYYIDTALSGGTTYGFSPTTFIQRPGLWLETITRRRGTATSAPNFAFQYCLRPGRLPQATLDELDLSSLRFLMAAAEPIKVDTYRRFLRAFAPYGLRPEAFFVAYGLAENTLAVTNYGRRALSVHKRHLAEGRARLTEDVSEVASALPLMSCGVPLGDTDVRIVDPETSEPTDDGAVGEIWVASGSTCRGYWGAPEATAATFEAHLAGGEGPFLRTGDLGFLHDGELYVCGRRKDVIILRGRNLYPQDIEAVVERVAPQVRAGYVAAFELDGDAEASVGIVAEIRNRRRVPDARAIITAVGDQLDAPVGLVAFVPPKSIPRTSSGKLIRHQTRQMWEDGAFEVLHHVARERSAEDAADLAYAGGSAFGYAMHAIAQRYGIDPTETATLLEAGIDSVDLVTLMLEVKEVLRSHGAAVVSEQVDVRLLQRLTVADLFRIVDAFEREPEAAVAYLRGHLQGVREAHLEEERAMMVADRTLPFAPPAVTEPPRVPAREILVTGGTGFLGPFLLHSLLDQTEARLHVLVRAASPEAARARLRAGFVAARGDDAAALAAFDDRVVAVRGDLERPALGLRPADWDRLATHVDAIYHNGAAVNYLLNYSALRAANVAGTAEVLRLAFEGRPAVVNLVSTTFIFGWATKEVLLESDTNAGMELLDFGYSQSKWVAERLVEDAARHGLPTRVFRPALITPSRTGGGASADITMRLLAFMIKHGIGVSARNQVSFVPADTTASNIVAIATAPDTLGGTFHVTRDDYAHMTDITDLITELTGERFEPFELVEFVPEVVHRCTRDDLLYPLLNFLIRSVDNISSMEFKRYDSSGYQAARDASPGGVPDPSMKDTVAGILRFIQRMEMA